MKASLYKRFSNWHGLDLDQTSVHEFKSKKVYGFLANEKLSRKIQFVYVNGVHIDDTELYSLIQESKNVVCANASH